MDKTLINGGYSKSFPSNLMSDVISTDNLNAAFMHVFKSRKKDGPHTDTWGEKRRGGVSGALKSLHTHCAKNNHQYLSRVDIYDADYFTLTQGTLKSCSRSPLLGAVILKSLDALCPLGVVYIRTMDDCLLLTKTRSMCRRLVKKMHTVMHQLRFKLALDKTYIGKLSNGFDFLGYRFNETGLIMVAKKTKRNFIERLLTLYEQCGSLSRISDSIVRSSLAILVFNTYYQSTSNCQRDNKRNLLW